MPKTMIAMVTISGVSSNTNVSRTVHELPKGFKGLTSWSVLALEELPGDDTCNIRPAVDAHDDASSSFPWSITGYPHG